MATTAFNVEVSADTNLLRFASLRPSFASVLLAGPGGPANIQCKIDSLSRSETAVSNMSNLASSLTYYFSSKHIPKAIYKFEFFDTASEVFYY